MLVESARAYGRGLLQGIAHYVRDHAPWSMDYQERELNDPPPSWLARWQGDGIIARVETPAMAQAIKRLRVPAVDLIYCLPGLDMPSVRTDEPAVIRMVMEYWQQRGFRQVAYCGFDGLYYSELRKKLYQQAAAKAGMTCHLYHAPHRLAHALTRRMEQEGMAQAAHLGRWLRSLPKPIALLACNDVRAQQVLSVCRSEGISVPDEIAVLGIDNDEVLCDLCDPPLSSVLLNARQIGYEAARLLEGMMRHRKPPAKPIYLGPVKIITRRSTDVLAIDDPQVAAILRLIRERACEGLKVEELIRSVPVSRTLLERRFTRHVGRSLKQEILRVQIERAKTLLHETDFSISAVAEQCGFKYVEYFNGLFHERVGQTPRRYRQQRQAGA